MKLEDNYFGIIIIESFDRGFFFSCKFFLNEYHTEISLPFSRIIFLSLYMQFRSINVARCFITSILVKDNQEHEYFFFSFSTEKEEFRGLEMGGKKKRRSLKIQSNESGMVSENETCKIRIRAISCSSHDQIDKSFIRELINILIRVYNSTIIVNI